MKKIISIVFAVFMLISCNDTQGVDIIQRDELKATVTGEVNLDYKSFASIYRFQDSLGQYYFRVLSSMEFADTSYYFTIQAYSKSGNYLDTLPLYNNLDSERDNYAIILFQEATDSSAKTFTSISGHLIIDSLYSHTLQGSFKMKAKHMDGAAQIEVNNGILDVD